MFLWDAQTGGQIRPLTGHTGLVTSLCFSPDGTTVASTSNDRTVRLWDVQTGTPRVLALQGQTDTVWHACLSPDGTRLAGTVGGQACGTG
jgi:WD40 repeat protein